MYKDKINDHHEKSREKKFNLKRRLVEYIYSTSDISKFKYEILEHSSDLPKLLEKKYKISANFYGKNCLLIFTKINDTFYSYLVDRKTLSYNYNRINMDNVDLQHVHIDLDSSIYDGTIFDGIYIKNQQNNVYVITDVYHFKGNEYIGAKLKHKLFEMKKYLENSRPDQKIMRNKFRIDGEEYIDISVNDLCDMENIEMFLQKINTDKSMKSVRGICFYPEFSGTKLIFIFSNKNKINSNQVTKVKYQQNQQSQQNYNNITHSMFVAKTDSPINATLEMRPTEEPDVYKLSAIEKVTNNNVHKYKRYGLDIAFIPNMDRSHWCRDIMNKSPNKRVLVKCIFRNEKHKWEPIEVDHKTKLPTLIDEIKNELDEIEFSDSDDE